MNMEYGDPVNKKRNQKQKTKDRGSIGQRSPKEGKMNFLQFYEN